MLVGMADRRAMYRSLAQMIDAHGVTPTDEPPATFYYDRADISEADADAFARDIEAIRNLPDTRS